jgi:alkylhydroperoxidase family enzyme
VHTASAKRHGLTDEQIAALKEPGGRRWDVFSVQEQALLRFTDMLTAHPGNVDDEDVAALGEHFSQEEIVDLVLVIATANWTNRVNDGLRTPSPQS